MIGLDPSTPAEWQEAADAADFMLAFDSALQYGLVTGPRANVERCEWILAEAKKRGVEPGGRGQGKLRWGIGGQQ